MALSWSTFKLLPTKVHEEPYKGYDLMTKLSDPALFEQGWEELNLKASCDRLTVEI